MRHLYSLVLSICCFAVTLQTQAVGTPLKKTAAPTEYQSAGENIPGDALNNFHQLIVNVPAATNQTPKAGSFYFADHTHSSWTAYILNDVVQNVPVFLNGYYAQIFLLKLIFPQHYHW
jgi:hypothetical protein